LNCKNWVDMFDKNEIIDKYKEGPLHTN